MKKKIYYIFALAALALAVPSLTACSDDAVETDAEMSHVRFCGALPADLQTRAYGDAEEIDSLVVGIFNEQQIETGRYSFAVNDGKFDIDISLMKGHIYNLVFWAQSSKCRIYDTSDLKQIKMLADDAVVLPDGAEYNSTLLMADAECKDAFVYVWKNLDLKRSIASYNLTLFRPLAQINVGRENEAAQASLTLNGMPDTFSTFENKASGEKTFTWNFQENTDGESIEVEGKEYKRIGLAYVFAPNAAKTVTGSLVLTDKATTNKHTFSLDAVTMQLNKRTNIVGAFAFLP